MNWLILLAGIASNASASVLVKLAMQSPRTPPSLVRPWELLANGPLWLGLGCYGLAFVLYALALARLPLNVAHPTLTAGAIAMVALSSVVIFHEPLPWTAIAGLVLILAGVVLITAKAV